MYNSKKIEGCQLDCASYPSVMRRRYSIVFSHDVSWQHWCKDCPTKKRGYCSKE